jgi:hypothetical protein
VDLDRAGELTMASAHTKLYSGFLAACEPELEV